MEPAELRRRVDDLVRTPGTTRDERGEVVFPELASSVATVRDGTIAFELHLEGRGRQVRATGEVRFAWEAECRRCLAEIVADETVAVDEMFDPDPVEGELYPLEIGVDGTFVDLEPLVREAALLALPLAPLCLEACGGPDPERFPTGALAPGPVRDPRWAGLDELDFGSES